MATIKDSLISEHFFFSFSFLVCLDYFFLMIFQTYLCLRPFYVVNFLDRFYNFNLHIYASDGGSLCDESSTLVTLSN